MKKFINILLVLLMALSLVACSSKEEEAEVKDYNLVVAPTEIVSRLENNETFVFYMGTTTCSHCIAFGEVVPPFNEKYNVEIYHVVLDEAQESDPDGYAKILSMVEIEYTPTTYFVIDGEVKESVVGTMDEEKLLGYMQTYGFIKE